MGNSERRLDFACRYKADVPHVRRVVQGAQGGFASGLMPHPPSERGSEPSSRDGGRGSNAGSDIPERSKQVGLIVIT